FDRNVIPIYFSTDNVFDGTKGDYVETDRRNPINGYGRIKCEVEDFLEERGQPYLALRMGKVFTREREIFARLRTDMQQGRTITCATDLVFTPLYDADLFEAVQTLIAGKHYGTFHLASLSKISMLDAANAVADFWGYIANIVPCTTDQLPLR